MSTDFNEMWGLTWEVQKTIPGAQACIVENTNRTFKSGRPVVEAAYYDADRREICRRSGMRLKSKKGNEYVVCRREPEVSRNATAAALDASDVFESITA